MRAFFAEKTQFLSLKGLTSFLIVEGAYPRVDKRELERLFIFII